jgi:hypothetical protein
MSWENSFSKQWLRSYNCFNSSCKTGSFGPGYIEAISKLRFWFPANNAGSATKSRRELNTACLGVAQRAKTEIWAKRYFWDSFYLLPVKHSYWVSVKYPSKFLIQCHLSDHPENRFQILPAPLSFTTCCIHCVYKSYSLILILGMGFAI